MTSRDGPLSSAEEGLMAMRDKLLQSEQSRLSYDAWKRVMLVNALVHHYIPGSLRPDEIDMGAILSDDRERLLRLSQQNGGVETGRTILADLQEGVLKFGKLSLGTKSSVELSNETEVGKERVQVPVMKIHVHKSEGVVVGANDFSALSPTDFRAFLGCPHQVEMVLDRQVSMAVVKTNVTPFYSNQERLNREIEGAMGPYIVATPDGLAWSESMGSGVRATKDMCILFGLVCYMTRDSTIMRRLPLNPEKSRL